ncbi:MAG: DUF4097 family beta strand repeat-containing protein [Thermoanaerobaculia bacterium]
MKKAALTLIALLLALPALAGSEEVFEKAFSLEGVTKVSVENVNGRVEAVAWDKPYLRVKAVKTARGSSAEETLKQTEIRVRKIDDRIEIETVSPPRRRLFGFLEFAFGERQATVDYTVLMPPGTELRVETCNGKVEATGFGGQLSADAVNGSIDFKDVDGPVRATTVNGSLRVAFKASLRKSHLKTVNGSVDVAFDKKSSVRYELETVNGRIQGDFDLAVEGKFGPKQARGSYNEGTDTLRVETVNGSIRLKTN